MSDAVAERHSGWQLQVVSGPNAGALVPLADGRYRLGSSIDNDIVLADPAMAEHQAVLSFDDDGGAVEAAAPGLVAGDHVLATGEPIRLTGASELTVGTTLIRFTPPPRQPRGRWAWVAAATGVAAVVAGLAFGVSRVGAAPAPAQRPVPLAQAASTTTDITEAQAALGARLTEGRIGDTVRLTHTSGAVVAAGTIAPDQKAAWMAAQMWFDGKYRGGVALVDQVAVVQPQSGPSFAIRAVSDGEVPYVIDAKGERYTVGAVVDGGWTIAYIGSDKVVLRKDGREVVETL